MPKEESLNSVLIIGSGPIVIGQACEFDYSGSQASRSLREEGIEVTLINSNPATIMTDNVVADNIYLLPLESDSIIEILEKLITPLFLISYSDIPIKIWFLFFVMVTVPITFQNSIIKIIYFHIDWIFFDSFIYPSPIIIFLCFTSV